jgi:hypothetical protein
MAPAGHESIDKRINRMQLGYAAEIGRFCGGCLKCALASPVVPCGSQQSGKDLAWLTPPAPLPLRPKITVEIFDLMRFK